MLGSAHVELVQASWVQEFGLLGFWVKSWEWFRAYQHLIEMQWEEATEYFLMVPVLLLAYWASKPHFSYSGSAVSTLQPRIPSLAPRPIEECATDPI